VHSPRKRASQSSWPPEVAADAPKVVWALDFQFDSSTDAKAIKIASMLDEHTRESLLNIVERSITAERLIGALEKCFTAAAGPPMVLRMDNGPELISQARNSSAQARSGCPTSRRAHHGTTPTSNRSTTGYEGSASTETTGPTCSKPASSSATSSTNTTHGTATQRWVT
jgi:Integrase core domain